MSGKDGGSVTFTVQGHTLDLEDFIRDMVIPQIRDQVKNNEVLIMGGGTDKMHCFGGWIAIGPGCRACSDSGECFNSRKASLEGGAVDFSKLKELTGLAQGHFDYKEHAKGMVDSHWQYVCEVMKAAGVEGNSKRMKEVGFHYRAAAHHFLRHGIELAGKDGVKFEDIE